MTQCYPYFGLFCSKKNKGTIKCSSSDFSDGYTNASPEVKINNGAVSNLQMIRFQLDKNYPNTDYDLVMTRNGGDNCKDVSRCFYDFINNADAKFDRSGNVISIQDWINEPIFCYKVNTDATSYNESLQVSMRFDPTYYGQLTGNAIGTNTTPSQIIIVCLYDETLRLGFDSEKGISTD